MEMPNPSRLYKISLGHRGSGTKYASQRDFQMLFVRVLPDASTTYLDNLQEYVKLAILSQYK